METILYFTDLHVGAHVAELAGVFDRAHEHKWRVIEIELERTTRSIRELVAQWKPAGVIMECSKTGREPLDKVFAGLPVVYLDPDPRTRAKAMHSVESDPTAICEMAAKELSSTTIGTYVYFGWCTPTTWSRERGRGISAEIKRRTGKTCLLIDDPWEIGETHEIQRRLAETFRGLPRPLGIFAVNDYAALQVTEACHRLGWNCPGDFILVSVDNEEMHCESSDPTLTSIEQDFRGAGRLSADLLAELIANPALPERHLTFGPVRMVRRQSSRSLRICDPRITRAVERIRRDATMGVTAAEILAEIPISRRLAEKRFLAATGHTILEEIQEVRLQKVFELLRTDLPIGHIAARCGIQSDSYLKRFFKAQTGMTLREWRKCH